MKRTHADPQTAPQRGRRRIAAERLLSSVNDPAVTVIEANRCDNAFRAAGDELEPSTIKSAHLAFGIAAHKRLLAQLTSVMHYATILLQVSSEGKRGSPSQT